MLNEINVYIEFNKNFNKHKKKMKYCLLDINDYHGQIDEYYVKALKNKLLRIVRDLTPSRTKIVNINDMFPLQRGQFGPSYQTGPGLTFQTNYRKLENLKLLQKFKNKTKINNDINCARLAIESWHMQQYFERNKSNIKNPLLHVTKLIHVIWNDNFDYSN